MGRKETIGLTAVIIAGSLFLVCSSYIYWWIFFGEVLRHAIPPDTLGPFNIIVSFGSIHIAGNLNLSNLAFSMIYVVLIALVVSLDEILKNLVNRIEESAKLPPLSVVKNYQSTSYTDAIALAGTAQQFKKPLPRR